MILKRLGSGVKNVSLNNLVKSSDIIFIIHLNEATENLINLKIFRKMKKNQF